MRIAVGSDARTHLTEALLEDLRGRGHEVQAFGSVTEEVGDDSDWPLVCGRVAEAVASGEAEEGIVCCWTGTGASIAANKVPGIRAALCGDAETARGARVWNHANVLALSLRATSEPVAKEILDAWFATPYSEDEWNRRQIERIGELEGRGLRPDGAAQCSDTPRP
jgi:ribose 5-phosphate isomerase B